MRKWLRENYLMLVLILVWAMISFNDHFQWWNTKPKPCEQSTTLTRVEWQGTETQQIQVGRTNIVPESKIKRVVLLRDEPVGFKGCALFVYVSKERHVWINTTEEEWPCGSAVAVYLQRTATGWSITKMQPREIASGDDEYKYRGYVMAESVQ